MCGESPGVVTAGALEGLGSPGLGLEFRVLGPLEALVDGCRRASAARASGRCWPSCWCALTRLCLSRGLWTRSGPRSHRSLLETCFRRMSRSCARFWGRDAIATRGRGYVAAVADGALDLRVFERRASAGARALDEGRFGVAAMEFRGALALWRGPRLRISPTSRRADGRGAP